jgi:hypothetical protein
MSVFREEHAKTTPYDTMVSVYITQQAISRRDMDARANGENTNDGCE